jgi:hypothetical protein
MIDMATGTQIGTTLTLTGGPSDPAMFIANGTRALITTHRYDPATRTNTQAVAVINTSTGTQVGTTFTVTSKTLSSQVLSADGTRALITTTAGNLRSGTTRVAVIDTITGGQTSTTVTGYEWAQSLISADGKRAVITTYAYGATRVAVLRID